MNDIAETDALGTAIDDCWNRIGVWGTETPRCPKLEDVVHCRNCEVYSAAGRLVLERRLPLRTRERSPRPTSRPTQ